MLDLVPPESELEFRDAMCLRQLDSHNCGLLVSLFLEQYLAAHNTGADPPDSLPDHFTAQQLSFARYCTFTKLYVANENLEVKSRQSTCTCRCVRSWTGVHVPHCCAECRDHILLEFAFLSLTCEITVAQNFHALIE